MPLRIPERNVVGDQIMESVTNASGREEQVVRAPARTQVHLYAINTALVTTEALLSLTPVSNFVAGTAGTAYTVPAGKTLRIQSLEVVVRNITTASIIPAAAFVRVNTAGAVTAASPIVAFAQAFHDLGNATGVIQATGVTDRTFADGIDIPAGASVGISQISYNTTNGVISVSAVGYTV